MTEDPIPVSPQPLILNGFDYIGCFYLIYKEKYTYNKLYLYKFPFQMMLPVEQSSSVEH